MLKREHRQSRESRLGMAQAAIISILWFVLGIQAAFPLDYAFQRDYFVALYYAKKNQKKKARKLFKSLIKREPNFFDGYIRLYELSLSERNWESALSWLKKAEAIAPEQRMIIDVDLQSFDIEQALKDVQERKKTKKEEKKKEKESGIQEKEGIVLVAPFRIQDQDKLIIYKGSHEGISRHDQILLKANRNLIEAEIIKLGKFSMTVQCQDTTPFKNQERITFFWRRQSPQEKQ